MSLSHTLAHSIVKKNLPIEDVVTSLRKYKLLSLLPSLLRTLQQIHKSNETRDSLIIESPFPLHDSSTNKIREIIGDTDGKVVTILNKNLLAGFKARYKGRLYDGSAERIIRQLMNHTK